MTTCACLRLFPYRSFPSLSSCTLIPFCRHTLVCTRVYDSRLASRLPSSTSTSNLIPPLLDYDSCGDTIQWRDDGSSVPQHDMRWHGGWQAMRRATVVQATGGVTHGTGDERRSTQPGQQRRDRQRGQWAVQEAAHVTGGVRDSARERRRGREMAWVTE